MARPQGELRLVVAEALRQAGPATAHELRARVCAGRRATTCVLQNMARAGEVRRIGHRKVPGIKRPFVLFELAVDLAPEPDRGVALAAVWGRVIVSAAPDQPGA